MAEKNINEPGILMRGPDGNLYFIPEKKFTAYKLDDNLACKVEGRGVFDRQILGVAKSPRDIGLSASDEPTQSVIIDLSAFLKRT